MKQLLQAAGEWQEKGQVAIDKNERIRILLDKAEDCLNQAREILQESQLQRKTLDLINKSSRIIEGIFDGQSIVCQDNKKYPVLENYASKSKLVVGDILKLKIEKDGTFVFKQIGPVERKKAVGQLIEDIHGYKVRAKGKLYQVLSAAVSYYKCQPGDKATIIIPKKGQACFGAIDNVIRKS